MIDEEKQLLEEVDFWLRLNNDYVLRHGKAPSRRMQEALFFALDRLRALDEGHEAPWLAFTPVSETLN